MSTAAVHRKDDIPPLCAGDRLTVAEFERRYAAMPELKKAELVEGVVYVPSPVSHRRHGGPHVVLAHWLALFEGRTPGVVASDNSSVRLDLENQPQPDLLLYVTPECGGRVRLDEGGFLEGPPELVVEIAASRVSYDLHDKLRAYRRNGVLEYLVWRVDDGEFDWFALREGRYERQVERDGSLHSRAFPGLWLDTPAALRRDLAAVARAIDAGTATPEHAAFIARLSRR